jgi:hypothetical protein
MGKQVGLDMKLYYNSASYAAPTWVLINNVRDLTGPDAFSEADVSTRKLGMKETEPALRDISIEWEMVYDDQDTTGFVQMQTNYYNRSVTELALADNLIATSGAHYLRVTCKLLKFERNEALEGANLYSVSAKPCWPGQFSFNTTP